VRRIVAFGFVFLCVSTVEGEVGAREPRELRWDLDVDGPITLVGATTWITTELLKSHLAPASCKWCDTNDFDRSVRDGLRWKDPATAETLGNILGLAAGPALMIGVTTLAAAHDRALPKALVDVLLVVESAILASDVNQLVKFTVGRERPWAVSVPFPDTRDAHLSFFSGHTTLAFAVSTAAGTVATMRGYRWAPLVWLIGLPYAFSEGYLRIAADQHWMTDVLVGMVAGSAIGVGIPFFFHRPLEKNASSSVRVVPTGAGAAIAGAF
jgi:membrane-associated phospholipid phosphatase